MSFYNIMKESAVQTPDDIGNDLDQIEKDILEDREDDADIASNGILNDNTDDFDPVSEGFMIMYESLYNHNQLLRAIGIHELNEAYNGRELILEAADVKAWFEKVKEIFVNAFNKICEVFRTAVNKLNFAATNDKNLIENNKDILEKAKTNKTAWEFEGYKYNNIRDSIGAVKAFAKELETEIVVPADNGGAPTPVKLSVDPTGEGNADYHQMYEIVLGINKAIDARDEKDANTLVADFMDKNIDALTADKTKEFANKVLEVFRGGKEKVKITSTDDGFGIDDLKSLLTTNRDLKYITDTYNKIKSQYKGIIKDLKALEKTIKKEDKTSIKLSICDVFVKYARLTNNLNTSVFTTMMKCARERRSQARAILNVIINNAKEQTDTTATKPEEPEEPKHESVFARVR